MDRCALFVDAGHLLAEAGRLCCGTKQRRNVFCDYPGLLSALADLTSSHCGLPILRTYWYDAAPDSLPTQDQFAIAELPKVKLRLGRLVGGKQKGVDSLIVRDLMTLARERAVTTLYLLGGDEDLREGVIAAQEMGVLVVVIGIPAPSQGNQAKSLIREADEHLVLETGFWQTYLSRVADGAWGLQGTSSAPALFPAALGALSAGERARLFGADFASTWIERTAPIEVHKLLDQAPIIPSQLDLQLLMAAETALGSIRERQDLKKDLRSGFWKALQNLSVTALPQEGMTFSHSPASGSPHRASS
jgi:hypothetical protein